MADALWCLMPGVDCPEMTLQAVQDCLDQSVPTRVLLIDQGSSQASRELIDNWIDQHGDFRVLCWHWLPPLPSLSAAWNRALRFVWALGGTEALVVNNDVRLHPRTVEYLLKVQQREQALFVTAVGVREDQYIGTKEYSDYDFWDAHSDKENAGFLLSKGGPDFSCFLISREGHTAYPFDESFIPCYTEDLDTHRRYMLGGDGPRIFSINLPFLHYASGTLKSFSPAQKATFQRAYAGVVERYTALWGGRPNQETFTVKGDPTSAREGVTTPELQRRVQAGEAVLP